MNSSPTRMDVTMLTMPNWFLQGGPLMWPLLFCTFLLITITLERLFYWWQLRSRLSMAAVNDRLMALSYLKSDQPLEPLGGCKDPALSMLNQAFSAPSFDTISQLLENAAKRQLNRMQRGQSVLDTIITLAPMLGILGTVMGIIESFQVLGGKGVDDPSAVIGGIAQALVTTAAGLSVAMMALLPYNRFRHLVQQQALRLEYVGTQAEVMLSVSLERLEKPVKLQSVSYAAG